MSDINESLEKICNSLNKDIGDLETLMSLPVEYIKSNLSADGLVKYVQMRKQLIKLLELVEVFVYDTNEEAKRCMVCEETIAEPKVSIINGSEVETLNGEITHWIANGKVVHDFTCDKCISKMKKKEM